MKSDEHTSQRSRYNGFLGFFGTRDRHLHTLEKRLEVMEDNMRMEQFSLHEKVCFLYANLKNSPRPTHLASFAMLVLLTHFASFLFLDNDPPLSLISSHSHNLLSLFLNNHHIFHGY